MTNKQYYQFLNDHNYHINVFTQISEVINPNPDMFVNMDDDTIYLKTELLKISEAAHINHKNSMVLRDLITNPIKTDKRLDEDLKQRLRASSNLTNDNSKSIPQLIDDLAKKQIDASSYQVIDKDYNTVFTAHSQSELFSWMEIKIGEEDQDS